MDRFTQLVDDLTEGRLSLTQVQIAIRASVRQRTDIPDQIKDLLCGKNEYDAGLIYHMFKPISHAMGAVELAFRRGKDYSEPKEDKE